MNHLNTIDYLFLQFRSIHIKLEDIRTVYYSHLCPEKMKEKARQQQLPFTCFRIDEGSQKGHFFVEIQLRTIAMDSWASLEHEMKYKHHIRNAPLIEQELKRCADELASCDISMQTIRKLIREEGGTE